MKATNRMFVALVVILGFVTAAYAGEPIEMSGMVWLDADQDGLIDDGADSGIVDVRVIYYRDYDCNGLYDGADAIYDYDFTLEDGYHFMPTTLGRCYIVELDPNTVPAGLIYTTPEVVTVNTGIEDYTAINFGLDYPIKQTVYMSGRVFYDDNADGLAADAEPGLEGARVMFTRDYDCNGDLDDGDVIYDYTFTDAAGNYEMATLEGRCYIVDLDPEYLPEDFIYTTSPTLHAAPGATDLANLDFGLVENPGVDEFVCPKPKQFWKMQLKNGNGNSRGHGHGHHHQIAGYTKNEMDAILAAAANLTDYFDNADDLARALDNHRKSNHHHGCGHNRHRSETDAQFAAFLLNIAAANLSGQTTYKAGLFLDTPLDLAKYTQAQTIEEALAEIEALLAADDSWSVRNAQHLARKINQGRGLDVFCLDN